jgi:hypothetical protein
MIRVGVSDDDPTNGAAGHGEDGLQVPRIVGSGVQHRHFIVADQVGIRTRTRHQACVTGNDAANAWGEEDAFPRNELGSDFHLD